MKKTNYITFGLLFLVTLSYGQSKYTTKADQLFESYQYVDAIEEYLRVADSKNADEYVYKQLAESYFNVFDNVNGMPKLPKAKPMRRPITVMPKR
jgi:hypothetical protein